MIGVRDSVYVVVARAASRKPFSSRLMSATPGVRLTPTAFAATAVTVGIVAQTPLLHLDDLPLVAEDHPDLVGL